MEECVVGLSAACCCDCCCCCCCCRGLVVLLLRSNGKEFRTLSADGEGVVLLLKPRREELARRAIAMFSAERKDGDNGEGEREVGLECCCCTWVRFLVWIVGGLLGLGRGLV